MRAGFLVALFSAISLQSLANETIVQVDPEDLLQSKVYVIFDTSGSMNNEADPESLSGTSRLDKAKDALHALLLSLKEKQDTIKTDSVTVVTMGLRDIHFDLSGEPDQLRRKIDRQLNTHSGTDLVNPNARVQRFLEQTPGLSYAAVIAFTDGALNEDSSVSVYNLLSVDTPTSISYFFYEVTRNSYGHADLIGQVKPQSPFHRVVKTGHVENMNAFEAEMEEIPNYVLRGVLAQKISGLIQRQKELKAQEAEVQVAVSGVDRLEADVARFRREMETELTRLEGEQAAAVAEVAKAKSETSGDITEETIANALRTFMVTANDLKKFSGDTYTHHLQKIAEISDELQIQIDSMAAAQLAIASILDAVDEVRTMKDEFIADETVPEKIRTWARNLDTETQEFAELSASYESAAEKMSQLKAEIDEIPPQMRVRFETVTYGFVERVEDAVVQNFGEEWRGEFWKSARSRGFYYSSGGGSGGASGGGSGRGYSVAWMGSSGGSRSGSSLGFSQVSGFHADGFQVDQAFYEENELTDGGRYRLLLSTGEEVILPNLFLAKYRDALFRWTRFKNGIMLFWHPVGREAKAYYLAQEDFELAFQDLFGAVESSEMVRDVVRYEFSLVTHGLSEVKSFLSDFGGTGVPVSSTAAEIEAVSSEDENNSPNPESYAAYKKSMDKSHLLDQFDSDVWPILYLIMLQAEQADLTQKNISIARHDVIQGPYAPSSTEQWTQFGISAVEILGGSLLFLKGGIGSRKDAMPTKPRSAYFGGHALRLAGRITSIAVGGYFVYSGVRSIVFVNFVDIKMGWKRPEFAILPDNWIENMDQFFIERGWMKPDRRKTARDFIESLESDQ